jgi:hypothetical protein
MRVAVERLRHEALCESELIHVVVPADFNARCGNDPVSRLLSLAHEYLRMNKGDLA